ncbi:MAG: methyltransferase [Sandaracinaceae bacterium]|nr:methyltransferase [Sandaracinaceae bacterium]
MDELTDDAIAGPWRILQRRRGHRYSLDDVATAFEAVNARPRAARYLDLGCGIGSVLLMVRYKLGPVPVVGVEAQAISLELARQNVARNGVDAELVAGDLREVSLDGAFDLVTGTPPYLPPASASPSTDDQRTYARIEMRGGIEDYVAAAARALAPGGVFVGCCDARRPDRALAGASAAGLVAIRKRDVVPRAGRKGALFTVWTFAHEGELVEAPPLVARDEDGGRTEMAHALRAFFDLPVNRDEPPSPGKSR